MGTQHVKSHTRTSKNGKTHRVRAHHRSVTFREYLRDAFDRTASSHTRKNAAYGAVGVAAACTTVFVLQTFMTLTASILTAIALMCISLISLAFSGKAAKPGKWFPKFGRKWRGPLAPKRRVRHFVHRHKKRLKRRVLPRWLHS